MEQHTVVYDPEIREKRELVEKVLSKAASEGTYMVGFHRPGTKIRSVRGKKDRTYHVEQDGSLRRI